MRLCSLDLFQAVFWKIAFSLGARALSFALCKLGLAGGLALAIGFAVRTLLIGGFHPYPLLVSSEGPNQGWTDLLGSSERESAGTSSSVNQQGARPAPAPNEVAPPVVPYPYQENEILGGDSVESIQRRLLGRFFSPSAHDIQMARIQAEDLFEVKVDIIRVMAGLDPSGDWMVRGERALENLRTATGEESLSRLHQMLDDLQTAGLQSATFRLLVDRVPFRADTCSSLPNARTGWFLRSEGMKLLQILSSRKEPFLLEIWKLGLKV